MNTKTADISEGDPKVGAAAKFAALSHPARLEILRRLGGSSPCCCKDVVDHLDLAQSTVSQHLKILVEAGLVRYAPQRPRSLYEINPEALSSLSSTLAAMVEDCCKPCR
ncbi:ArsR/SmtB family transcription factor [Oryzicola mucosus]|uniref:Winged helix-turn-helix transcriptional regulator n=1 Tax=Oryzicola mucosus TaxID=2767425 RepID=A0A8J6U0K7_9HYPH|nr:metalloregulator ArsR/SmtB family transcription factor [Oryzicola mucosus]MBD0415811.1 winged helix-turn-helix transcriptional regulator [Oryzicola mucosus]